MRARGWWIACVLLLSTSAAADDPKPKPIDVSAVRGQMLLLGDSDGGLYAVVPGKDAQLFYSAGGKTKTFYEQSIVGRSSDGSTGAWAISVWAPRVPNIQPGSVSRKGDGTFTRWCGNKSTTALTEVPADKATAILDKAKFLSSAMIRRPYLLARDDAAVYYYVDVLREQYGGNGHRVYIGKKGAMKVKPLTDVTNDSAGDVFATKTGDLRIVRDATQDKPSVTWVKGEKRTTLFSLDLDVSSALIFKDLGIYAFTGSICESI
jgi:hypothetical protein